MPSRGLPGATERGDRSTVPAAHQDDRPLGRGEKAGCDRVDVGQGGGRLQVAHHDGEGLLVAALSVAQPLDGCVGGGVAGEVIAAQSLDRHDLAAGQCGLGRAEGRVGALHRLGLAGGLEPQARPAVRTGDGLGVEAPIGRVVVLRRAGGAHRKARHGGVRPVVGQAACDREAGPAVGAIDERVARPPVGWVVELGQAIGAGRDVR